MKEQPRGQMEVIGEAIHDAFRQSQPKLYGLLEEALAKGVAPRELKRWVDRFGHRNGQGLTENAAAVTIDVMVERLKAAGGR